MKAIMTGVALAALISGSPVLAAGKWQQVAQADQQPAHSRKPKAPLPVHKGRPAPRPRDHRQHPGAAGDR